MRGPITAPAIQALLLDFFFLCVVVVEEEMSVGVAVSAPSSVVLAAAVAERRVEGSGYCQCVGSEVVVLKTDWLWSLRRRAGRGSRTS